jgi:pimeloyl-ACP methyl ester carboxylesterase
MAQNSHSSFEIYSSQNKREITITSLSAWEQQRLMIRNGLEAAMGPLPDRASLNISDIKFLDTLETDKYLRLNLTFLAADNEWVPTYLYLPKNNGTEGKSPAIIALHPTGELGRKIVDGQGNKNRGYAKELAERGYVVIAPDYPSFGDLSDYDFNKDRYESATMAAIFFHMRSIDLLCKRPEVDTTKIGVIGHSLGGHNGMFLAAFDDRVRVIVASCGWTQFENYDVGEKANELYGGRLGPWAQDRYMPLLRDKFALDGKEFPFNFHEIIALLAPRYFFSNSPVNDSNFDPKGVENGISKAKVVYEFLNATDNLQVRYPKAEHDFPTVVRTEAYEFIDAALGHVPSAHFIE